MRWLSVCRSDGTFVVRLHHVYDSCDPEFLDVTEFAPVDDDEDVGVGIEVGHETHPKRALQAAREHGAEPERWVNQFVVASEYIDGRCST